MTRAQKKLRTESRQDMRAISVGATNDYMDGSQLKDDDSSALDNDENGGKGKKRHRSISINITEEALRRGKLPPETVARNIAQNRYNTKGGIKKEGSKSKVSPRVREMVNISERIKTAFDDTGEAPETTTEFYRAGKMLGRGAFGKVNLGMHKLTRKLIAIKSIN